MFAIHINHASILYFFLGNIASSTDKIKMAKAVLSASEEMKKSLQLVKVHLYHLS